MKIGPKPPFKPNAKSQVTEPTTQLLILRDKSTKVFKDFSKKFKAFKRISKGFFTSKKMQHLKSDKSSAEITKLIGSRLKLFT